MTAIKNVWENRLTRFIVGLAGLTITMYSFISSIAGLESVIYMAEEQMSSLPPLASLISLVPLSTVVGTLLIHGYVFHKVAKFTLRK